MAFRTELGAQITTMKYFQPGCRTWEDLSRVLAQRVCGGLLTDKEVSEVAAHIQTKRFIPGGRYLYYANRPRAFFNNCLAFLVHDSRESWAELAKRTMSALMCGGGVGVNYSELRGKGTRIEGTGGVSSGPLALMSAMNEIGRNVRQGGSRRSAMFAGLNWDHPDANEFIQAKIRTDEEQDLKARDFNYPLPFDMTNMSLMFDDDFIEEVAGGLVPWIFRDAIHLACQWGEPGMTFDLGSNGLWTQRNACGEFISNEEYDLCNLGSLNMAACQNLDQFGSAVVAGTKFLMCGLIRAEVPFPEVSEVRKRAPKIGLGLMGVHEWLLQRGLRYEPNAGLGHWLSTYANESDGTAYQMAPRLGLNEIKKKRAVAPAGTIAIVAGTTSGIEPVFAVAMNRRYLVGDRWEQEYIVDPTAKAMIEDGVDPDSIETSADLAKDPERRIQMQAFIQQYVDMGISSTINLPAWGTEHNNKKTANVLCQIILENMQNLRGLTIYPDGAIPGQILEPVPYRGDEIEVDISESQCKGGVCGI